MADDYKHVSEAEVEAAARAIVAAMRDSHVMRWGESTLEPAWTTYCAEARAALTAAAAVRSDALAAITELAERAEATIRQARDILGRGQPDRQPERKEAHRVLCLAVAEIDGAKL